MTEKLTAARLGELLAGATPGPWTTETIFGVTDNIRTEWLKDGCAAWVARCDFESTYVGLTPEERIANAALIVALVNAAEQIRGLLEQEEAKTSITWVRDLKSPNPTDHDAVVNGEVKGWTWKNHDDSWFGNTYALGFGDDGDGARFPTEAAARAAVEAAVRAGK